MGRGIAVVVLAGAVLASAARAEPINYCVFDPLGAQGTYYSMATDYQIAAKRWGVELVLHPYTQEGAAVADFQAGRCDLVGVTGLRARLFNRFSGTIDAPGAVYDYAQVRNVMALMASPKLGPAMISGATEVVGVYPMGGAYTFTDDRTLTRVSQYAGKKIAVLGWDQTESIIVEQFKAEPVASDIDDMGKRFNAHTVNVMFAPAILYKPYELYRGLGDKGGIIRAAALQVSMQLIARREHFPAGFGQQSRSYVFRTVDQALGLARNAENEVEPRHWMYMSAAERRDYYDTVRHARTRLAAEGFYDSRMLAILKRVRCGSAGDNSDCSGDED